MCHTGFGPPMPVVRVTPIKKKFSDYFTPEDVQRVRDHDLDVVLRFGFRILRGDALKVARHGVSMPKKFLTSRRTGALSMAG